MFLWYIYFRYCIEKRDTKRFNSIYSLNLNHSNSLISESYSLLCIVFSKNSDRDLNSLHSQQHSTSPPTIIQSPYSIFYREIKTPTHSRFESLRSLPRTHQVVIKSTFAMIRQWYSTSAVHDSLTSCRLAMDCQPPTPTTDSF